jgi:ESF2/ABP1 family protein
VKDQKMAAEVAAANRERDFYLSRVDKAKAVEAIIERQHNDGDGGAEEKTTKGAAYNRIGGVRSGEVSLVARRTRLQAC